MYLVGCTTFSKIRGVNTVQVQEPDIKQTKNQLLFHEFDWRKLFFWLEPITTKV